MVGKPAYKGPAEALERFEAAVASIPGVERKGAAMPYTSFNGHMFSFLDETGTMALRLPAGRAAEFVARYKTEPVIQHGAVLRDYVAIPMALLNDTAALREWLETSYAWAGTLKPKATTRRKKT